MPDEKPMNLIQKLASIRRELKNIEKKGRNQFQNYDYLRAEDIAGELGDRLAAMNIVLTRDNLNVTMTPIETVNKQGEPKTDMHALVTLDYIFYNGDAYGVSDDGLPKMEYLSVASAGEGRDPGDKAVPKALTNALKYALTQPLMMRVGDDPEADSHEAGNHAGTMPKKGGAHSDTLAALKTAQQGSNGQETAPMEGQLSTLKQRKMLLDLAKGKMGDAEGLAWVKEQMVARKIPDPKLMSYSDYMAMVNLLDHYEEPDIAFAEGK